MSKKLKKIRFKGVNVKVVAKKPKGWPLNPFLNPKPEAFNAPFAKQIIPACAVMVEERDKKVLEALANGKKWPRVPFDPFFWVIMKRDRQIKDWLKDNDI